MNWSDERARNFGSIADLYERVRPGYPAEAIEWMLSADQVHIADVGTGTGKLTDALIAAGRTVTAVDPDPGMLAVLAAKHPGVPILTGTAEQLPFDDATFDAVTFGQSWHWVEPLRGSAEVARILKPGGSLGLFWNIRDAREPWVAELADVLGHQSADEIMMAAGGPSIGPALEWDASAEFTWVDSLDVETLVGLAATHGFVLTASDADREKMLREVRALSERVADGDGMLALPYRVYVYRFRAAT